MISQLFSRERVSVGQTELVAQQNRTEAIRVRAGDFMSLVLDSACRIALQNRPPLQSCCGSGEPAVRQHQPGTFSRSSMSQTVASESLGARQSPRGESDPPEPTLGPFGMAVRLNWLI